jgi:hypothetical protein
MVAAEVHLAQPVTRIQLKLQVSALVVRALTVQLAQQLMVVQVPPVL